MTGKSQNQCMHRDFHRLSEGFEGRFYITWPMASEKVDSVVGWRWRAWPRCTALGLDFGRARAVDPRLPSSILAIVDGAPCAVEESFEVIHDPEEVVCQIFPVPFEFPIGSNWVVGLKGSEAIFKFCARLDDCHVEIQSLEESQCTLDGLAFCFARQFRPILDRPSIGSGAFELFCRVYQSTELGSEGQKQNAEWGARTYLPVCWTGRARCRDSADHSSSWPQTP